MQAKRHWTTTAFSPSLGQNPLSSRPNPDPNLNPNLTITLIEIDGETVEQVDRFKYLRSTDKVQ